MLPTNDADFLAERFPDHLVQTEGGVLCVVISNFQIPGGLNVSTADLLLRLMPGYPDIAPDMWWFDPHLSRRDGSMIPATEAREQHLGRLWQRWSRHLDPSQWRAGIDCVESYLAIVRRELAAAAQLATAS